MYAQSITTTKLTIRTGLLALLLFTLLSTMALAHGGEEHVRGTVTKTSVASVTVRTTIGKTVTVGFDAKTNYARADKPIQNSDIRVGDRIVIHAVEVNEKLVAHTVQVGIAPTAKSATKP